MINLLKGSFKQILNFFIAAFAPSFAMHRADGVLQRRCVVVYHIVAAVLAMTGLVAIQITLQLDTYVRSSLPMIRMLWLPLVGTLVYSIAWSAWFIAHLLRRPPEKPMFDSVTLALRSGLDRFSRAGIDLTKTPLYLVLGAPTGGIREFFAASHTELAVLPSAEEANEPVQVCGNRDAIYVCCRDSSLVGNYTRRSAEVRSQTTEDARAFSGPTSRSATFDWRSGSRTSNAASSLGLTEQPAHFTLTSPTLASTATSSATATLQQPIVSPSGTDATIQRIQNTLGQLETLAETEPLSDVVSVLQPRKLKAAPLRLEATEADVLTDRLTTICQELNELRQPFCPINGVLIMIPLHAADTLEMADHVGMRLERDLNTIIASVESSVSAHVIFCDLDLCEGSQPFLERFPESQRHRRLGAVLPAVPSSEQEAAFTSIDRAIGWICDELFPPLGYRLMMRDLKDASGDRNLCIGNHRIQRLVEQTRERREGMSRMLRRSIACASSRIRIRGCFLAATGMSGHTSKQAFCEGVIPMILDIQNEIQWTKSRRDHDRWQRRAAAMTYVSVAIATTITAIWLSGFHA